MKKKLISILVDGLSANYVQKYPHNVPNIIALGHDGFMVERMTAPVPGISMPGRASMLTGYAGAEHGVYGNHLLRGRAFHPADPLDLRRPTIASLAKKAGMDVACIGAALIDRKDASIWMPPAWMRGFLDNSRFVKEIPPDRFEQARLVQDPDARLAKLDVTNPYAYSSDTQTVRPTPSPLAGFVSDQIMMTATAALACSHMPPDVILTEIDMPDSTQHEYGYESEAAHFAIVEADALIGSLMNRLRRAGREDMYNIAIASDHGHGEIRTAINVDVVLPNHLWQCEGATLHVVVGSQAEREEASARLKEFGVEPWSSQHIPDDQRSNIATFIAPDYHAFEVLGENCYRRTPAGPAKTISTHGLRPGHSSDERFCVFYGPDVETGSINSAPASHFAHSCFTILGFEQLWSSID